VLVIFLVIDYAGKNGIIKEGGNVSLTEKYKLTFINITHISSVEPHDCWATLTMLLKLNVCKLRSNGSVHYILYLISTSISIGIKELLLTHWHTQPAVRQSEPSMSFAFNSSLLSVDGMTCLLPFESW